VIADQPAERQIHVILDNLNTHKKNDDWLAAHPNVTFRFTPTQRKLAQSSRNLVRHLPAEDIEQCKLPQHRATRAGHQCLHGRVQRERRSIRVAQT